MSANPLSRAPTSSKYCWGSGLLDDISTRMKAASLHGDQLITMRHIVPDQFVEDIGDVYLLLP